MFDKNTVFHGRRVTAFLVEETYVRINRYKRGTGVGCHRAHPQTYTRSVPVCLSVKVQEHHGC
ncbi:MAG: hypothetical protein JRN68_06880 [Nitrososphaerota archaeon]|nr:hypothetical protein [Nitrososphaerota archaeon]